MSREKQIEEIAYILDGCCDNVPDNNCATYTCSICKARQIYDAGFRKHQALYVIDKDCNPKIIPLTENTLDKVLELCDSEISTLREFIKCEEDLYLAGELRAYRTIRNFIKILTETKGDRE